MLISADVKGLEVVTCAFLSGDPVLSQEVRDGVDFHESNKVRFNLPSRTIAKRFKFKLIYGATAWGYAHDGDFVDVSTSERFWQGIIDEYYGKYSGIKAWHVGLVTSAISTGEFHSPTGRTYKYPPNDIAARQWFWRPKILNYPVQGLGADLVMLARISFWNRLKRLNLPSVLPVLSIHDSIVIDTTPDLCYTIGKTLKESVEVVPMNFERMFGTKFTLPLNAEIKIGPNMKHMERLEC